MTRSRKYAFRGAAIVLTLTVLWGIPELAVRLADPELLQFRAINFGGDDPGSPHLFVRDPHLHWALRPRADLRFGDARVRVNRHGFRGPELRSGSETVLAVGDSTPFGYLVEEDETFAAVLAARLDGDGAAAGAWQFLNAGVPGYSSHQALRVAERLIARFEPAIVVVCVGNNDGWLFHQSDRQVEAGRALTANVAAVLQKSEFLVWLAERFAAEEPQPFIPDEVVDGVPRVSADEYEANLTRIAELGRAHGATVVLLVPPVNLYYRPNTLWHLPDWDEWQPWWQPTYALLLQGAYRRALTEANAVLRQDEHNIYGLWIKGLALTQLRQFERGRELLETALELMPFPETAKRSYRRRVAAVARRLDVGLIDVNQLLWAAAPEQPAKYYLDWCHPTAAGHRLIAEAVFAAVRVAGGSL